MKPTPGRSALILVTTLFFLWALTSNLLPILIPHLKKACHLSGFSSALIDTAYWISYFFIALPAGWVMKKYGYKNAIITGLLLAATGAFLFYPAAESRSYPFFLGALFVVAAGMTFLETAANPLMTQLGEPETAPQRLNFAQAFNGLGSFIASAFISKLIISKEHTVTDQALSTMDSTAQEAYYNQLFAALKLPYISIGLVLLFVAVLFLFIQWPNLRPTGSTKMQLNIQWSRYPQLRNGIVAQFFYVGAQVCVSSFFIAYATKVAGITEYEATNYLGMLLLAFMLGRYAGTLFMKFIPAPTLLFWYALLNILLSTIIVLVGGKVALFAFIGVEFFMSIMYPTIFSLSVKGLGDKTEVGAAYLVMAIVGGALLPLALGKINDWTQSIQWAYIVPLFCFIPVAWFGWKNKTSHLQNNTTVGT